jgi:peptidoglycan/xylan/chitin deacetylase (PgdA/CDA1 family)
MTPSLSMPSRSTPSRSTASTSIPSLSTPSRSTAVRWGGRAALALAVANAAAASTTITPARTRLLPRLAGVGRADHVALTFDDGPDPVSTPRFLDALEALGVTATFFVLGSMLERDRGLGRALVDAGHEVGVHGWLHRNALTRSPWALHDDLRRGRHLVAEVTGVEPGLYRPPYGVLTANALLSAHRLGMRPVLWTAWARDWEASATPARTLRTVTRTLRGGGTVLLHDSDCTSAPGSWRVTLALLPRLVEHCRERGLAVGPLREHEPHRRSG